MVEIASIVLIYFTFIVLTLKRMMTYMHVLQQEDYDNARLSKWISTYKAFDKRLSLALIVLSFVWAYVPDYIPHFFFVFMIFISMTITTYIEKDPRKNMKKKLVATDRAKRIFFPAYAIMVLLSAWVFVPLAPYNMLPWPWVVLLQLIPFVLKWTNSLMNSFESIVQKVYWNEARQKIVTLKPVIIGITGSFGKTSVKHILGHILGANAPTLITPGSVNTLMGITRVIREQLSEEHKYFVVEMGAYGPGSIEKLCELCPPDFAIITSIGHAHYERFKSLEVVSRAKYEIAEAVLNNTENGKVVIHERTLKFPYARAMKLDNRARFIVCGDPPEIDVKKRKDVSYLEKDDVHILLVEQQSKGLAIKFTYDGKTYNLEPHLYGIHHGHNTVLAASCAMAMGIDIGKIQLCMRSLPQIAHRLEVKPRPEEKYTLIDDSYNSNPIGFRSALELMTIMGGGRKILITPGMVELGIAHDEAHEQIGYYAAQICDIVVVVKPDRIRSFVKAVKEKGKELLTFESFQAASEWLEANREEGDIVLIENDLPDMYERIPKM